MNASQGPADGMMAFWATIAPEFQAAYSRWHNNEHIPERLGIPGFLRGRRYRSATDDNRFLMYYDTASLDVLTSAAYLAALNAPTERTKAALRWFAQPTRSTYKLVAHAGSTATKAAHVLAVTCFAPPEGEVDRSQRQQLLERLRKACNADQATELRLDSAGTTVKTGEAAVHGAKASLTDGLLVMRSADLRLMDDASAWEQVRAATKQWADDGGAQSTDGTQFYSLEFALDSERHEGAAA
ncbi:hypothetical protein ACO2Q9_06700 [Variovorax sp. VNK109]|jgi:hypothetical protein|uniref:hypothetical protein n=1 Tax=Variovorax sp. VNK109 TaxID=3400919 RepID=UPI003C085EA7